MKVARINSHSLWSACHVCGYLTPISLGSIQVRAWGGRPIHSPRRGRI